jgi:hypothetical protein
VVSEGYLGVVKSNEGKVMVKYECNSSLQYVCHFCQCLVYSMLNSLLIIYYNLLIIIC